MTAARRLSDALFLAIAHPARREILELTLERGELSVSELRERFAEVTASALSQHLRVLKDAGLLADRRDGRNALYRLTPEPLLEVVTWMREFERGWNERLGRLGDYLDRQAGLVPFRRPPQRRRKR